MSLIQQLPWTNIDIIGDIHGEIGALTSLLDRLNYDSNGKHPKGRKLVFVGDIVDRGPDSIAVFQLVRHIIDQENGKCVLGNHELNLIIPNPKNKHTDDPTPKMKNGNHWFHGLPEAMIDDCIDFQFQRLATDTLRKEIQEFCHSLPLVLESKQLGIVHACWHQPSIDLLRNDKRGALEVYNQYYHHYINKILPNTPNKVEQDLYKQNHNPIKIITSGLESRLRPNEKPYYAGKQLRYLKRDPWWRQYSQQKKIIFGHYWRRGKVAPNVPEHLLNPQEKTGVPDLFNKNPDEWLGPQNSCMCIDYSVGRRFWERHNQLPEGHTGSFLAALQITNYNESFSYNLLFDNGLEIVLP
jgi:hypothetical protein